MGCSRNQGGKGFQGKFVVLKVKFCRDEKEDRRRDWSTACGDLKCSGSLGSGEPEPDYRWLRNERVVNKYCAELLRSLLRRLT